jgi:chromate reductase
MRILGISGSLRRDSHNRRLLLEAAQVFPADTEFELFNGLKAVPPYDDDDDRDDEVDAAVSELRGAIARADAVLIATPEYNSSVPGQLKNAIDWASRPRGAAPLLGKPVAVIGASTGSFGGVWAQAELKKILRTAGARLVDGEVAVPRAHVRLEQEGRLLDDEVEQRLLALIVALLAETRPVAVAA